MEGREIRESFLRFFEERGHKRVPSSSLIPPPESGLLLTNAGMNQFIPYFLGHAQAPFPRAVTAQKVFRALDIDNVGHTARHLTLFEMLGNFSFGDYFKKESCAWGLELVTQVWGIDRDRIWVTVFETDDETVDIWQDLGIQRDRIVLRGVADNYWWTHAAGPAGPCSEIYVDRGERYGPEGGPAVDEERYVEIWNHVFMQDEVDDAMSIVQELPAKNIDTGSSLERVAMVLQDVDNIFETDLIRPLLAEAESVSGRAHGADDKTDVSLKVIAEHGRATAFLIADGVQPSNEGRGYVLRRMLRRTVSHARRLGIDGAVLDPLITSVIATFGDAYPELRRNETFVRQVAGSEEERFAATLRQGLVLFEEAKGRAARGRMSGDDAFKLSDTFGFPLQLTEELAEEAGLSVDTDRFAELPEAEEGQEVRVFLDRTPFYAEGGGQVGDRGLIRTPSGVIRVVDTVPAGDRSIVHVGVVESGEIRAGDDAHAEVDADRREATARAHTSTHVVHATLRSLLGEHARQAGSLVEPGRLRFDFPHPSPVSPEQLQEAELIANRRLTDDDAPSIFETSMDEAKRIGAVMLFGEKYGDTVRVVEIGDYSRELCGGTHVARTGNIGVIRLLHEGSIGAGMRRVDVLVGPDAIREINAERALLHELVGAIGSTDPRAAIDHARKVIEENRRLRSELGKLQKGDRDAVIASLVDAALDVDGLALVV